MANLVSHAGLLVIVIAIYAGFGYLPTIYYLQIPFYMALMFLFFAAWGIFGGVISSVSRDFYNLVKSLVTALFWMSGILYDVTTINNDTIRTVLMFNPVTIIVNGYRDCFINKVWFWENWQPLMNFAIVYAVMAVLAAWAYKKLKKDIPDVL
jgi:teichoic acid transport system permease protein